MKHSRGWTKGFAVVAEDVLSLSEQSTVVATTETEQILKEIHTETNQVTTAMEASREQVIAGTYVETTKQEQQTLIVKVSAQ